MRNIDLETMIEPVIRYIEMDGHMTGIDLHFRNGWHVQISYERFKDERPNKVKSHQKLTGGKRK